MHVLHALVWYANQSYLFFLRWFHFSQDVYPPLLPSLYKLFSEQEQDRMSLLASHVNEVVSSAKELDGGGGGGGEGIGQMFNCY